MLPPETNVSCDTAKQRSKRAAPATTSAVVKHSAKNENKRFDRLNRATTMTDVEDPEIEMQGSVMDASSSVTVHEQTSDGEIIESTVNGVVDDVAAAIRTSDPEELIVREQMPKFSHVEQHSILDPGHSGSNLTEVLSCGEGTKRASENRTTHNENATRPITTDALSTDALIVREHLEDPKCAEQPSCSPSERSVSGTATFSSGDENANSASLNVTENGFINPTALLSDDEGCSDTASSNDTANHDEIRSDPEGSLHK